MGLKVYSIEGKLSVPDNLTHQEMLSLFYDALKEKGIHFAGATKEVGHVHNELDRYSCL
ncbi:hypothetical protein [Cytobacillus gottheilii]|uniref:hypothetical protein n=1 Tax=Cytobacillus gottheilii TaxID=859144 RepID=UPI0015932A84|nr:hypothetical protein [Cytobacillus gottheilii]